MTRSSLQNCRQRAKRAGLARVEVQVRQSDAALLRSLASALNDPARETKTRALLRECAAPAPLGLKAMLLAAPLEGIDLERSCDAGRSIEL